MEALTTGWERDMLFRRRCFMVIVAAALLVVMIFVIPASNVSHDTKLVAEAAGGFVLGVIATRLLASSKAR